MKWRTLPIYFCALFLFEAFSFAQSPPVNDDFANRVVLTGSSVTFTGTLQNATIQSGEPLASGFSWPHAYYAEVQTASVWWSWTASASGAVTIEVLSASTNTFKLGALEALTGTNWSSGFNVAGAIMLDIGRHPFLTFAANGGTTYQLRVVGTNFGDFTLRIIETNTPIIVVQPFSRTVTRNEGAFFGVVAAGNPPMSPDFSYQWRFNGLDLPGETFPILGLDNLTTNQSGGYSVMVSNAFGGTLSETAILNVTETAAPPHLAAVSSSNGQFAFKILGDFGRLYRIQSSTNLVNWSEEESFPREFIYYYTGPNRVRNGLVYNNQTVFSFPQSAPQKYYQTTDYVPPLTVCINHLAQIRFAKEMSSLEGNQTSWSIPGASAIGKYLKIHGLTCPLAGPDGVFANSYTIKHLWANPTCMWSANHVLEEPEY